jgi:hypothetical protein
MGKSGTYGDSGTWPPDGEVVVVAAVVVVVAAVVVVVAAVVVVVAAVVVVVAAVVVVVGATVVVVVVGSVDGPANELIPLKTKLLLLQAAVLSPTQIEHGLLGSQVSTEPESKPPGLLLLGSPTSGVVDGLPVGRIQNSIVKLTLPSALGTTGVVWPTDDSWMVRPSHWDCEVGLASHSSKLRGVPAWKMVLA